MEAAGRLASVSTTARIDANALATAVFDLSRADLISRGRDEPTSAKRLEFQNCITRRLNGEPVAYITGYREFWSLTLEVNPDVLIPRPETEHLVEHALAHIDSDTPADVLDLGTGTGAIALSIAKERELAQVVGADASDKALVVARKNASTHALNVEFVASDWFESVGARTFDVIVSNPPYVAEDDPHLQSGDVQHEPNGALASGPEGLDDLQTICKTAPSYLKPGGWLLVEHGFDQGPAVRALFRQAGFEEIRTHRDLNMNERVTEGRLNAD